MSLLASVVVVSAVIGVWGYFAALRLLRDVGRTLDETRRLHDEVDAMLAADAAPQNPLPKSPETGA